MEIEWGLGLKVEVGVELEFGYKVLEFFCLYRFLLGFGNLIDLYSGGVDMLIFFFIYFRGDYFMFLCNILFI